MEKPTQTLIGKKAREAIYKGVNAIFRPVSMSLGPNGRNILMPRSFNRGSQITNDGYQIAEIQEPKNPFIQQAASAFKEGAKRTNQRVGDGTTGTIVVAGKLFNDTYQILDAGSFGMGISTLELKRKINETANKVKEQILLASKKIETLEELEDIATISVEDKDLGKIIAGMAWKVGTEGYIDVVEGFKGVIETEVLEGLRFPAKIPAKGFVNNPNKYEMVGEDMEVIVTNHKLDNLMIMSQALTPQFLQKHPKLLIIANSFSNEALENMYKATYNVQNAGGKVLKTKGALDFMPIACPSLRDEQFEDLAIYFGSRFINKEIGGKFTSLKEEDLGFVKKFVLKDTESREDAVAIGGKGAKEEMITEYVKQDGEDGQGGSKKEKKQVLRNSSRVLERINMLKGQLLETRQDQFKKLLERRIASLASATAIIRVGSPTDAETYYKKLKIEDAVYASKSALKGGYVKGGGLCLKEIADTLPDDDILKSALLHPYTLIKTSLGGGDDYTIAENIIDPAEVVWCEVEHAVSVVSNLITVDMITIETQEAPLGDAFNNLAVVGLKAIELYRKRMGIEKENLDEINWDSMGGMTMDEHSYFDFDNLPK